MEAYVGAGLVPQGVAGRRGQMPGSSWLQARGLEADQLQGVLEVLRTDMLKTLLLEVVKWIRKERLGFERPAQSL